MEYVKALNASVARGQQPTDFNYASTFTESKIPRLIHFIWFQDLYQDQEGITTIPSSGSHAPDRCRQYNPNYEIKIWNATAARNLLATEYPWFLATYDDYRYPIQRVDALKYFLLWHYGGIYMDLDIACRRALDPLLDFPAWFPEASPLGVNNDLMASAARHPLMERFTASLKSHDRSLVFPYLTIFYATGPQFASDILQSWYEQNLNLLRRSRTHLG
jgi:mannosyltransferase OCH1-like enzyme